MTMHQNPSSVELVRWAEALAGIARTGLGFTQNPYEVERYEEVLAVAADIRAHAEDDDSRLTADDFARGWMKAVGTGTLGYVTPKVAIGAIVGNDAGELLLIQRADSGSWLYPTGWADVGYSPAEVAIKEVREETGIRAEVVRPVSIIDGMRAGFSRVPLYSLVFLCRAVGGQLAHHPQECLDVGWFGSDSLPQPLARGQWAEMAFDTLATLTDRDCVGATELHALECRFDAPRDDVWRSSSRP